MSRDVDIVMNSGAGLLYLPETRPKTRTTVSFFAQNGRLMIQQLDRSYFECVLR